MEILPFNNPRLQKVESKGKFGFKLEGYKNEYIFYCIDPKDIDDWIGILRNICVSYDILTRYTLEGILGKGTDSEVNLDRRKCDNESFAIKTIQKSLVLSKHKTMMSLYKEL